MRAPTPSAAAEIAVPDVRDIYLRLASLEDAMTSAIEERLIYLKRTIASYRNDIARSLHTALLLKQNQVEQINRDLKQKIASSISMKKLKLAVLAEKLNSNNPIHIMERGFFPISSKAKRIYEAKQLKKDDEIEIKFSDGEVFAKIVGGITHEQDDV
jgi:exodeoxyribonuclease 7 large subunit